jgi:peptide/nickel transport system substrate-binding protein
LVFVGVADLSILDPVVAAARPTRNAAYLVFDTLYGINTEWKAQPQMVEGHTAEEDGLTWTLKLRDGLRFHDNEPVLARDVVASIRRFAPRVIFANALMNATDELSAPDDRTVRFRLKRPFPHLPEALAGPGGNVPAIMPERLAAESPFKPVAEVVGSGPYRFLKDEHVSGARAVFERYAEYQPRAGGPVGFTAGPKVAHFDRVEWLTLDPFSASAALRRSEIDWWENPPRDLVDQVNGDPNITVVSHFATANGIMTFNHLYPPFDNPKIRRALLGAVDQAEAMSAIAGSDRNNWRDDVGLFGTGSPFAIDVGIEVLRRPRDYVAVKRALADAGYKGEKIVVIVPTDARELGDLTRTGAEQLRRAGMKHRSAGHGRRQLVPAPRQPGPAGEGRLQHVLHPDRPLSPKHPSFRQCGHSRRRQGAVKRLGRQSASRNCAPNGSTRPIWSSKSGSASICRNSSGKTCRSSRWANTGRQPPTASTSPTSYLAALRPSTACVAPESPYWSRGLFEISNLDGFSRAAIGGFRRVSLVARPIGERLLTEPVAGARLRKRELVLLPQSGHWPTRAWSSQEGESGQSLRNLNGRKAPLAASIRDGDGVASMCC